MSDDAEREDVHVDENEVCTLEDIRLEGNTNEGEEIDEHAEVADEEVGNDEKKISSRTDGEEGGLKNSSWSTVMTRHAKVWVK